jgi:hypothetical protein
MKNLCITCAIAALLMAASCRKHDESISCYQCELKYAAFGHGTAKLDTICADEATIRLKEDEAYISNDSIQQSLECKPLNQ